MTTRSQGGIKQKLANPKQRAEVYRHGAEEAKNLLLAEKNKRRNT